MYIIKSQLKFFKYVVRSVVKFDIVLKISFFLNLEVRKFLKYFGGFIRSPKKYLLEYVNS